MFQFCGQFDGSNVKYLIHLPQKPDYVQEKYPDDTQFFEFECLQDNEGTPYETPSKTYFNFLLRRAKSEGHCSLERIMGEEERIDPGAQKLPEYQNFVFIWKNPQKQVRLMNNQHKLVFRTFKAGPRKFVNDENYNLPGLLLRSLNYVPDYREPKFQAS